MMPISDTYASPDRPHVNEFYVAMVVPLTFNILSLLGSIYIFYRTYLRWKYNYDKINLLSIRFPFYIAITDFLYSFMVIIDFSHSVPNISELKHGGVITWPSPYCEIFGFFNVSFMLLNMLLVGAISLTTWLRVVQEYYFDWGKYDYKIWFPIIFSSFLIPIISVHEFGAQTYWCGIKHEDSLMLSALVLAIIILTLLTIVICYAQVLTTIHNIKDDDSSTISSSYQIDSAQYNNIERKTLTKVLTYTFVFLFQYIPLVIADICKFLNASYVLLYALTPSAISIGGLSNLFQYIRHEGFLLLPPSSSSNNNIVLERSNSYNLE